MEFGTDATRRTLALPLWLRGLTTVALLVAYINPTWAEDLAAKSVYMQTRAAVVSAYAPRELGLNDTPQGAVALDEAWTLLAKWAADYLTEHRSATPAELKQAMNKLDPGLSGTELLKLRPNTFLVGFEWQDDIVGSNYVIIGPKGTRLEVLWNIKDTPHSVLSTMPTLSGWHATAAEEGCQQRQHHWFDCGPIQGEAGKLPDSAWGDNRFYIRGVKAKDPNFYNQGQLSIWTWDGKAATPIFAKDYPWVGVSDSSHPSFDGQFLRLDYMDDYKNFEAWPIPLRRNAHWSIGVTPAAVHDAGLVPYTPEMDAFDDLVGRIQQGRPTVDLSAPAVVKGLHSLMDLSTPYQRRGSPWNISIGPAFVEKTDAKTSVLCIPFLGIYNERLNKDQFYRFTLQRLGTRFFISNFAENENQPCRTVVRSTQVAADAGNRIKQEYDTVAASVDALFTTDPPPTDPKSIALLWEDRSLTQEWICAYLDQHQWEGAIDLTPALRTLGRRFSQESLDAVRLDDHTYLIGMPSGFGSPCIAQARDGRCQTVWSPPDEASRTNTRSSVLVAGTTAYLAPWSPEAFLRDAAPSGSYGLDRLPDTISGDHRFYFLTTYHHDAGAVFRSQLTVWRWHAGTAILEAAIDTLGNECPPDVSFDGKILHVPTRVDYNDLFVSATNCAGVADRRIEIGPTSTRYIGTADLTPELTALNQILIRLGHHKNIATLASRRATLGSKPIQSID